MSRVLVSRLLVAAAACATAACGGGGGGGGVSFNPPAPTLKTCPDGSVIPTTQSCPTPPPPVVSPAIFAGVTADTDFAVLGLEAAGPNTSASALARTGFSARYDAGTQAYLIALPSLAEFQFESENETDTFWYDFAATGFYTGTFVSVFKPTSTNPEIQLSYTSFGASSSYYSSEFGYFAFGIPTPASAVPVIGSAEYDAIIVGQTLDAYGYIDGTAALQFDFGAGTLTGQLNPVLHSSGVTNLGSYTFINTVFGVGSATFSGGLSHSGTSTLGAFDGRFTGPAAQELMGRWTAPYYNPDTLLWKEMFGVMVGKKQ